MPPVYRFGAVQEVEHPCRRFAFQRYPSCQSQDVQYRRSLDRPAANAPPAGRRHAESSGDLGGAHDEEEQQVVRGQQQGANGSGCASEVLTSHPAESDGEGTRNYVVGQ